MCKKPISAEHFSIADWNKANGTNAMERLLAHHEFVGIWRRGSLPLQAHIASIIHVAAKARMRFQPASVRQVDRTRSKKWPAAMWTSRQLLARNVSLPAFLGHISARRRMLLRIVRLGIAGAGVGDHGHCIWYHCIRKCLPTHGTRAAKPRGHAAEQCLEKVLRRGRRHACYQP